MAYDAGDVMDTAAALLNDTAKALYTYAVQLPYLRMAQEELEQHLVLNEVPMTLIDETVIPVAVGADELVLPSNFFIPIKIEDRKSGTTHFRPAREVRLVNENSSQSADGIYTWDFRRNIVNFVAPTSARDVRLIYWAFFPAIADENTGDLAVGAKNTLSFRTAALSARYIGGNVDRSTELNIEAAAARDLLLGIFVKNSQALTAKRRPFRGRRRG